MDVQGLKKLLERVADGSLSAAEATIDLQRLPFSDLGYARVDHHREVRQGLPEVVFGEGKTAEQLVGIVRALREAEQSVLVTRVDAEKAAVVQASHQQLRYNSLGRTLSWKERTPVTPMPGPVAVVTAGTSDQGVAEEAAETLEIAGVEVERVFDVGVAGIHRLFEAMPRIEKASAVICIAGMEGALPSVLGGLVRAPLVAVPTSVGYGAAMGGLAALMGMLTGCASGVSVVNIDNGFGAAMAVLRMAPVRGAES